MIKIAVMGYGTVGSGVVEVFYKNRESIQHNAGHEMDIKYILDLREFPDSPYVDKFTKNFEDIINDDEIKIVVEVMGGATFAYDYVKRCLLAGKSVATSNKELVAEKGAELIRIAKQNNTNFLFEASVGGGIPILRPITQCLAANDITEIYGILNGTTNYILTKMINEHAQFDDALKTAQELGYAERNPAADIEGHDACRKICILSALAFGKHVYPKQVYTEGITNVSLDDVSIAGTAGYAIKLIGKTVHLSDEGKVFTTVYPALVRAKSQIGNVDGVYNAVMVRGDAIGDVVFYGQGAGKLPTASAVVADVIDCAKHLTTRKLVCWEDGSDDYVKDYKLDKIAMYVRIASDDLGASESSAKAAFGDINVISREGALAFITPVMPECDFDEKIKQVSGNVKAKIRVLDL
ncbi:MAG: homoserine dehydrogenase [Acutalibacteraceae bacterium]